MDDLQEALDKLPTPEKLFDSLCSLGTMDTNGCNETKAFFLETTKLFYTIVTGMVLDKEYVDDPQIVLAVYLNLHYYNGGLQGLATALMRRIRQNFCDELELNKTKIVATDKDRKARGLTSDLEGILKSLEETQINLHDRIYWLRSKNKTV